MAARDIGPAGFPLESPHLEFRRIAKDATGLT